MAKTYAGKLKDPRWQKRRLEIMNAAGFICDQCGNDKETFNVHHKLYLKGLDPWEYEDKYLECLCEKCHKEWHQSKDNLDIALANPEAGPYLMDLLAGYTVGHVAGTPFSPDMPIERQTQGFLDGLALGMGVDSSLLMSLSSQGRLNLETIEAIFAASSGAKTATVKASRQIRAIIGEGK